MCNLHVEQLYIFFFFYLFQFHFVHAGSRWLHCTFLRSVWTHKSCLGLGVFRPKKFPARFLLLLQGKVSSDDQYLKAVVLQPVLEYHQPCAFCVSLYLTQPFQALQSLTMSSWCGRWVRSQMAHLHALTVWCVCPTTFKHWFLIKFIEQFTVLLLERSTFLLSLPLTLNK